MPAIHINDQQGNIKIGQTDESGNLDLEIDFRFALIRGSVPWKAARQLASDLLRATQKWEENGGLPQWYLDEATPRIARMDELALIAYPSNPPNDPEGINQMYKARKEWDQLARAQNNAEVIAGL